MGGPAFARVVVAESLWGHPDMRRALVDRDMATVLRLVQLHAPRVSQQTLATAVGMSPPRINEVLNRKRRITGLDVFERIADGLDMPDSARIMMGIAPLLHGGTGARAPSPDDARAERRYSVERAQWRRPCESEHREEGRSMVARHQRATSMAAAESARFGRGAEETNVGPYTLSQLHADLHRVVSVYPYTPVFPLFCEVRDLRDQVFALLGGRQHLEQTRELYLLASALCGVLSNSSFDLGNFSAAETQARTALLAADHVGHNGLRSWIRGMQALIAYWDKRPRDAAELAAAGWEFVPERGTARVRVASIEARAHARLGDEWATRDALRRSEQAREQVTDTDTDELSVGMMAFPPAKQQFYAGAAHLSLSEDLTYLARAEQLSAAAVHAYLHDPPETRRVGEICLARLDWANACLDRGDLETAADQIGQVLDQGSGRRTESIARKLQHINAALTGPTYRTTAAAVTLRERIANSPVHDHTPPALPEAPAFPGGTELR